MSITPIAPEARVVRVVAIDARAGRWRVEPEGAPAGALRLSITLGRSDGGRRNGLAMLAPPVLRKALELVVRACIAPAAVTIAFSDGDDLPREPLGIVQLARAVEHGLDVEGVDGPPIAFSWVGALEGLAPQARARWEGGLGRALAREIDDCAHAYEKAVHDGPPAQEDRAAARRVHRILVEATGAWLRTGARWELHPLCPPNTVEGPEQRRARREQWNDLPLGVQVLLLAIWCRIERHLRDAPRGAGGGV